MTCKIYIKKHVLIDNKRTWTSFQIVFDIASFFFLNLKLVRFCKCFYDKSLKYACIENVNEVGKGK